MTDQPFARRIRTQNELMQALLTACFGDKDQAIRLIEYERKRDSGLKTLEAIERALDRLCYDRGRSVKRRAYSEADAFSSAGQGARAIGGRNTFPPDVNLTMVRR